jgi:hypothetical protein
LEFGFIPKNPENDIVSESLEIDKFPAIVVILRSLGGVGWEKRVYGGGLGYRALKGWLGGFAGRGGRTRTLGPLGGGEGVGGKNGMGGRGGGGGGGGLGWIESIEVDMDSLDGELRKRSDDAVVVLHVVDT